MYKTGLNYLFIRHNGYEIFKELLNAFSNLVFYFDVMITSLWVEGKWPVGWWVSA